MVRQLCLSLKVSLVLTGEILKKDFVRNKEMNTLAKKL